jgi:dsRNA-specific ribonuclease
VPQVTSQATRPRLQDTTRVEAFREAFGYTFNNPNLLKEALTKSGSHPNYERLEFLGDSILGKKKSYY